MAGRQYRQVAYGLTSPLINENPTPVVAKRDPTASDFALPTTIWTNTTTNTVFILASVSNNQANWIAVEAAGGAGVFASLTVTPGPISLTGTTTINTAGAAATTIGTGGTGVVNIGNATGNTFVTGALSATGSIASSAGQIFTTNGAISAGNTAVSTQPATFQALKSRGGGVITTGDGLGQLLFAGFDGTQQTVGAAITSTSSGTIANTRVAGNLAFITHPDAPGASATRMTINSAGNVVVNAPDAGTALTITAGGLTVTAGGATISGTTNINTAGAAITTIGTGGTGAVNIGNATGNTAVTGSLNATTGLSTTNGNVTLGNAANAFIFQNGVGIYSGTGDPNGVLNAAEGSLYLNTNGAGVGDRAWINTNSGTVWTAITTAT